MKMSVEGESYESRAINFDERRGQVQMIDQRLLPHEVKFITCSTLEDICDAIKNMTIRGAPAIGAAAAYGMAVAALHGLDLIKAGEKLKATRPTANDLFYAIDYMISNIELECEHTGRGIDEVAMEYAEKYASEVVDKCKKIGLYGSDMIKDGMGILTHCNAGALATVDYGTALAPLRVAWKQGKKFFVFVDETRPRLQGSKLTAWELKCEGIPHTIIPDNAAGYYMWKGDVDMVITGADRVVLNGDAANKIGTYEKAVVAKENGIPFYIAVPMNTFDPNTLSGKDIPIEERDEGEVLRIDDIMIAPEGSPAKNPAFDVIPSHYIAAYITEFGIFEPKEMASAYRNFVGYE